HAAIAVENDEVREELQSRTGEVGQAVAELRALGEVSQAVSSTLDLQTVLATIVARAVTLSGTSGGIIYEYDEAARQFHPRATHRMEDDFVQILASAPIPLGEEAAGRGAASRAPLSRGGVMGAPGG